MLYPLLPVKTDKTLFNLQNNNSFRIAIQITQMNAENITGRIIMVALYRTVVVEKGSNSYKGFFSNI